MYPNDITGLVAIDKMAGENAEETELLRLACVAAERYLLGFSWCKRILEAYFGDGVAGVVQVFLFRIVPSRPNVDEWVWVIVGDVPPAYLVTDECKAPSQALERYVQGLCRWVELARRGKSSPDVIPISVPATPEEASRLEKRINLLREFVIPRFRDGETRRA